MKLTHIIFVLVAAAIVGAGTILALWPATQIVSIPNSYDSTDPNLIAQGAYISAASGCVSCHWDKENGGQPYAGGLRISSPFGAFISPNITPDQDTGIGNWSPEDFVRLIRHGLLPSGKLTFPAFPWSHYRDMTDEDALALYAYLQSLDPVVQSQRGNELPFPFSLRSLQTVWRWAFLPKPEGGVGSANRGAYLVDTLGHCGACHTPRNIVGGPLVNRALDGVVDANGNVVVPGLTKSSGLADWSVDELEEFLTSGTKPDYDTVEGEMALVILHGTSKLTPDDFAAMIAYLKKLP